MRVLVLGGTAFLGRAVAGEALRRGHAVTCLARGTAGPPAPGVELVRADRDHDEGLRQVAQVPWDAVVEVSRQPGQVRQAVRAVRAEHWVFISSANVYADPGATERDEDCPLLEPLDGDVLGSMADYGRAKVACERLIRSSGTSSTVVRAGLIGGPGDVSGRSGYWPWRFAHPTGPDVIVPDDLDFPCALIDVRDLATWTLLAAERRLDGTFNATGPTTSLGQVLAVSARVADRDLPLLRVPVQRLRDLGVGSWMGPRSLPLWIDDPGWRGFATLDTRRARATGLTARPLEQTLADALAYEDTRDLPRQAGLTDDEERQLRDGLTDERTR